MMAAPAVRRLIDRLPPVRGRYRENAPLAPVTWFRVGGPAEVLFRPADVDDLGQFLAARPAGVPITVLGVGSNVLVRDGGVPGVVIRLGREFAGLVVDGADIHAGAAAMDINVARLACAAGIAGLEFLSGVPGTIGGALRMNAGAFGGEVKDVVVAAEALDGRGRRHWLNGGDLGFGYRSSAVPADRVFVSARLRGRPGETGAIAGRMDEIRKLRERTQPMRVRTGGSTFTNPPGQKAWKLIEAAGCRGLTHGEAMVAEKHCNFLINTGSATAADLEALGEEVRRRVLATSGVALHWEIRRLGIPASDRKIAELVP
jgi:UDP-N-acetylmuramate dehydrogenase